ncbi:L-type lectin-domain containing receptor kinase S.4-like [Tripterygium wilfordii]|uniref:L-type lectin-domain containing receptor kinase S.4-like n=1 Tax=Tripterygium wilfordii TaxID=458696 RepID=A0A7J7CWL7_TRIWF|nr:L-type lectin-domain containing receptor kinase S.4-like [Tripterygium wilfordii]
MAALFFHIFVIFFFLLILIASPIPSLALQILTTNNRNFDTQISLLGDAENVGDGSQSYVQLTRSMPSSSGLIFYKEPFHLTKTTSFSTDFSFSVSPGKSPPSLTLIVGPYNLASKFVGQGSFGVLKEKSFLGIEFDTSVGSNAGINVGSFVSVKINNVKPLKLDLDRGEKLRSWIDFNAISRRVEVRLSRLGDKRPYNPVLAYSVDLSKMWGENVAFVGLGSSSGNSSQTSSIYAWSFSSRKVPNWMHSLPVDPRTYKDKNGEEFSAHRRRVCPLTVFARLIFVTGCGALLAFVMLFVWAILAGRHSVFPVECNGQPVDFQYEKISLVVEEEE